MTTKTPVEITVGTRNLTAALEALVDAHSVEDILFDLSFICAEKAEHIRANWQDSVTAKNWDKASKVCERACAKVAV